MRQDRRRRRQREQQECIELYMASLPVEPRSTKKFTHANPELVRGIGVISPPVKPKASVSSWDRGMKRTTTVGVAPGADAANGPSMKVTYSDGSSTVRSLGKAKARPSDSKGTTAQPIKQPQHHITAADLAPIGDQNH
jgi:hypothetical protein